jgi:hypothetical protein
MVLAAVGFRVDPADAKRQCAFWGPATWCDGLGNLTQTRTEVPHSHLATVPY